MRQLGARHPFYYVGVHHKTGYVWMKRVHESIARRLELPLLELIQPVRPKSPPASRMAEVDLSQLGPELEAMCTERRGIVFDRHSRSPEIAMQIPHIRGMHMVRDPRDVLVSATFYHLKSHERWLHRPMPRFDGLTYQQRLRATRTLREAFEFELNHKTGLIVHEMAAFPRLATAPTVTYESLMVGDVLAAFESMFHSLGFAGAALDVALDCAREESLVLNPARKRLPHVRSGAPGEWRGQFDRELGERFVAKVGEELIDLGYETDHSWLMELPARRPTLDQALSSPAGARGG